MKANMTLRTHGDHHRRTARRPSSLRLIGTCAVAVLLLLGLFAGSSRADVNDYTGTQLYLIGPASGVASGSYRLMPSTGTTGTPQGDTRPRVAASCLTPNACGYMNFPPGTTFPTTLGNSTASASPTIPAVCKGWVVDGTGGMVFPTGSWQFAINVKIPAGASGSASLVVGMWKVDNSGAPVSGGTLIDPTAATSILSANMVPFAGTTHLFSFAVAPTVSSFTLSTNEHLCVMVWRDQITAASTGGAAANTFSMLANDTNNVITHPAPDGFPSATLSATPADGGYVIAGQSLTLGATYSDPESQAGTVVTQVCSDSGCSSVVASNTATSVASGSTVNWSPALADGTYYWRASANDGTSTTWSSTKSFTLNTTVPTTPALVSPSAGATTNSLNLTATFSDPSVSDTGTVEFRLCSDSLCSSVVTSGSSPSVTNGANGTWTITPAPADGLYYWEARNHDMAGNASGWSASRSVTFDRTPPTTTIGTKPPATATTSSATFGFSASESSSFECNLDGAGWGTPCTSTKTYTGLADGSHSFQVRGTDAVGNVGAADSWSWSIDTTIPVTPALTAPADATLTNTIPQLGATFTDPTAGDTGTAQFRICTAPAGAGTQCSPLVTSGASATVTTGSTGTWTPSSLADGTYDWQAKGQDTAGNASGWSATRSFTLDATPPDTSILTQPPSASNSTTASFTFSSTESPSTFQCSLDGAAYSPCTSPVNYAGLTEAPHTFSVRATDPAGNTDPSPATYGWTVDTTPPDTTIGPTQPSNPSPSASATFDLGATEPSTYSCSLDGGAWTACATPKTYSGLSEGNHTFQVKATDAAGNVDATPASRTWFADTSVPSMPTLVSPNDGFATNVLPQFKATFTDPVSSDTGTVEFRICSAAAASGACSPAVQDVTSATLVSGATATYAPAALPDGQYWWQARAQDAAGNQSAWTATRMVIYDTGTPLVPALDSPADGAWIRATSLHAQFSEPAFAGTGWVEFRICPDALCLAVTKTGNSDTLANGSFTAWLGSGVADGTYWWQARAHDIAGNLSPWSVARSFHLDATPPAAPPNFNGQVLDDGLTLRWDPPQDAIGNFVVYVNGEPLPNLGATTYELKLGPFDAGDTRKFSVRAIDLAGNVGALSPVLVGVPNVVGLTLDEAQNVATARGLVLRRDASLQRAGVPIVVSQDPEPGSLEAEGSSVKVVAKLQSGGAKLAMAVSPKRVACAPGSVLRLRIVLSRTAVVRARILNAKGRVLATRKLGLLHTGTNDVKVKLPRNLPRGARVVLDAPGTRAHSAVKLSPARRGCTSH